MVEATAHAYMHSLPRHKEEIINNMLRQYKINALIFDSKETGEHGTVECDLTEYITIPLEDDNSTYNRRRAIRERKNLEQHDRAKIKEETRQLIDDYYKGEER